MRPVPFKPPDGDAYYGHYYGHILDHHEEELGEDLADCRVGDFINDEGSKAAKMLWLEMTGMVTRVSENFLKSNAKMRKVAKSRETKNRLAVAELKKERSLALDKIKKMETTLRSKDEEIAQISNER